MKTAEYRGEHLAEGSHAHQLLRDRKYKELDAHMRRLQEEAAKRGDVPLLPCRSPYCECDVGACSSLGRYDARGTYP